MPNTARFAISNASVKRAIRTFVVATLALFIPGLLGWLHSLTEWARSEGATPFPDAHGLAYLAVSAITAGVIALTQLLWNYIEDVSGKGFLRDVPATPKEPERGSVYVGGGLVAILLVVLLLVLLF